MLLQTIIDKATCLAARCLYASVSASTVNEELRNDWTLAEFVAKYDTLLASGKPF